MTLLIVVVVLALIFDFINGFHDAANSIATVVSTRVLSPLTAVIWAAGFNFLAYWIFELKVADTVAKTVKLDHITLTVVISGLIAAIIWNLLTWWWGIPSSSSHTLIGGFAGAGLANAGSFSAIQLDKVMPTVYFIVLAPIIGMILSYFISVLTLSICRRMKPDKVDTQFRRLQLLSSAAYSLGHGGNDAQKVMGIIAAAMFSQGMIEDTKHLPEWVPLSCYIAIAAGTLIGGWRIVKTMGQKVTKLTPFEGFGAETAGAFTLFLTQYFKIPVSTTHTITGAIIGVGITKRISAVRWGVTIKLLWAWVLTIPVSAALAMIIYLIMRNFIGE
ncbi:MAG: inorganic phosphate transporter family protein [Bacteroidetes bacterium]|nr:inorganic phosphate transporter family protein [Bacteroidota bacterium]